VRATPESPAVAELVEQLSSKAGVVWIAASGQRARPAWHHWHDGADYVVTGGIEQPLPGLVEGGLAEVMVPSKDTGGRLITWAARVREVAPGSELWAAVVPAMHAKRLNPPDGDQQPERWARECILFRLEPTGEVLEARGSMPQESGAAPPVPTPATTSGPLPYVLGRRQQRR
jgi:hypothetical protein